VSEDDKEESTIGLLVQFAKDTLWLWTLRVALDGVRLGIPVAGWIAWQRTHDVWHTIGAAFCSWGYVAYVNWGAL
jgi:hypothetical protein